MNGSLNPARFRTQKASQKQALHKDLAAASAWPVQAFSSSAVYSERPVWLVHVAFAWDFKIGN